MVRVPGLGEEEDAILFLFLLLPESRPLLLEGGGGGKTGVKYLPSRGSCVNLFWNFERRRCILTVLEDAASRHTRPKGVLGSLSIATVSWSAVTHEDGECIFPSRDANILLGCIRFPSVQ